MLVAQEGTELMHSLSKLLGILIIPNYGYFRDKKRMNPDQVSWEDRLSGEAEFNYPGRQLVFHSLWPIMQFVFNQPVSTVMLKVICVASYLRGF